LSKRKFRMFDVLLLVICVVFVAEAAAPAAAIGNSQYFWWILLIILFQLPYGLIVSELGSTYEAEGGFYDWVKRAFGDRWAARTIWFYWLNYPLWMASLAVLFPKTISLLIGHQLGVLPSLAIELVFIWIVVYLGFTKVSDSRWVMNLSAVLKVFIVAILGGLGIYYVVCNGFASPMTLDSFFPDFGDTRSLTYLSIILFNFMGFEVIATFASSMENPSRQIPRAIIIGGVAVAAIYLIGSFGIGAAIPAANLDTGSGIMDAIGLMAGVGTPLYLVVGVAFLATLFGNMASWSYGVSYVADYAAKDHNMPRVFGIESCRNGMPVGSAVVNGIISSILCGIIALPGMAEHGWFWSFFGMSVIFLLLAYIPLFPAFLRLRRDDPDRPRPFRAPGRGIMLQLMVWVPVVLLVLAIAATIVPLNGSAEELAKIPMLIATVVFSVLGEVVALVLTRRHRTEDAAASDGPASAAELAALDADPVDEEEAGSDVSGAETIPPRNL